MFLSKNKKKYIKKFYYIKVGFKGVKIKQVCFRDGPLAEISAMSTAYVSEQHRFGSDCTDAQTRLNFCC